MGQALAITIVLALIGVIAACSARPGAVLGMMIASMLLWPEYLRIPIGLAQMSVPRFMALTLIVRLSLRPAGRPKWCWIDTLVVVEWTWGLLASVVLGAEDQYRTYMIGRIFDTVCMYYAARLALQSLSEYAAMIPALCLTAVVMGTLGLLESIASWSPYTRLFELAGVGWFDKEAEYRYGFLRAKASTGHAIYFGVAMVVVSGLLLALRPLAKYKRVVLVIAGLGIGGVLSSMSSGPQMALAVLFITLPFSFVKSLIKPALACLAMLCVFVEFASNRHFFSLIDYLALSSETAWYRTRLLEVAMAHVSEFWLMGYGGRTPHHWAAEIDGRLHVDLVNHYIIVAVSGGIVSFGAYVGVIYGAGRSAVRVARLRSHPRTASVGFMLVCLLTSIGLATMSVGLFGPPLLLTYVLMGAMVSLPAAAAAPRPASCAK
jgi:hypothetical protein